GGWRSSPPHRLASGSLAGGAARAGPSHPEPGRRTAQWARHRRTAGAERHPVRPEEPPRHPLLDGAPPRRHPDGDPRVRGHDESRARTNLTSAGPRPPAKDGMAGIRPVHVDALEAGLLQPLELVENP